MKRARPLQLLLPALLVVALLGVVVVAATGSASSGSNAARSPSHVFVDTFFTLALVLMAGAAILLVYGLTQRRAIAEQMALRGTRRTGLIPFLVVVIIFTAAVYFRLHSTGLLFNRGESGGLGRDRGTLPGNDDLRDYHANFAWLPLLVIAALALASYLAWRFSRKRQAPSVEEDETISETLAQAIEETLDDLRAEQDPRRAIVAAYARMERALAAYGIPRRRAETQAEYLARILGALDVDTGAIERLTQLFTQAKFSHHEIGAAMKEEAIGALEQVRDELRAAEERSLRELEEQQAAAVQA